MGSLPISLNDVENAAERIKSFIYRTPLYYTETWSSNNGAEAYLKLECYQPIHAFKIRGAANKLSQLTPNQRKAGVVAASSGNHGLAVAYISKKLGIHATIVVPTTAVTAKVEAIEEQGATIIRCGIRGRERIEKALDIAAQTGATFVHSFDDPQVIAGQGTVGLEIYQDLPDVQTVIVPVGGGGLISGIAVALKSIDRSIHIIGVQAEGAPSMYESLKQGRPVVLDDVRTVADGLSPGETGKNTLPIVKELVDKIVLVNDDEIREATTRLLVKDRILVEPSGAAGLAAIRKLKLKQGEKTAFVISGGNISIDFLRSLLINH